jgi:hypothetical protein
MSAIFCIVVIAEQERKVRKGRKERGEKGTTEQRLTRDNTQRQGEAVKDKGATQVNSGGRTDWLKVEV